MGMRGEEVARAPLPVTRYGGVLLELGLATPSTAPARPSRTPST